MNIYRLILPLVVVRRSYHGPTPMNDSTTHRTTLVRRCYLQAPTRGDLIAIAPGEEHTIEDIIHHPTSMPYDTRTKDTPIDAIDGTTHVRLSEAIRPLRDDDDFERNVTNLIAAYQDIGFYEWQSYPTPPSFDDGSE